MSDIVYGKLISTRAVVVRFMEVEATVPIIVEKLRMAMANDEDYVLTDSLGNEILESEGTPVSILHYMLNIYCVYSCKCFEINLMCPLVFCLFSASLL